MRDSPTRLDQLRELLILDSPKDPRYDEIAQKLAKSLNVPIVIVNLLDEKRDWFKACIGLVATQSPATTSLCETFFKTADDIIVAEDTLADDRFSHHPFVLGPPFIRFYAAARLKVKEQTMGTLCAYDVVPHKLAPDRLAELRALAERTSVLMKESR